MQHYIQISSTSLHYQHYAKSSKCWDTKLTLINSHFYSDIALQSFFTKIFKSLWKHPLKGPFCHKYSKGYEYSLNFTPACPQWRAEINISYFTNFCEDFFTNFSHFQTHTYRTQSVIVLNLHFFKIGKDLVKNNHNII